MIDFSFTKEQELLRDNIAKFATKELAPKYNHWDRNSEFPYQQVEKMAKLGLMGVYIPEEYGGNPLDDITIGLVMEEIARGDFNCVLPIMISILGAELLCKFGTEEQKREWLPPMASAEKLFALGCTEPDAGSDLAHLKTKAVRDGDDFVLNGEKNSVSMSNADNFFIMARSKFDDPAARGISIFMVPRDAQGVSVSDYRDLGCRAIPRGAVAMEDVRIPRSNMIGEEGRGFQMVISWMDLNRIYIALKCVSVAMLTLRETMEHAKNRQTFGKPLARFEGISFPLAEAETQLEAARWLCYRGLWLRQRGLPYTKEAAMVKWWGPKISTEVIHKCLLLHGHYGYSDKFPIEQRLRDVMGWQIGDGTGEVQKIIIARESMGREYLPY